MKGENHVCVGPTVLQAFCFIHTFFYFIKGPFPSVLLRKRKQVPEFQQALNLLTTWTVFSHSCSRKLVYRLGQTASWCHVVFQRTRNSVFTHTILDHDQILFSTSHEERMRRFASCPPHQCIISCVCIHLCISVLDFTMLKKPTWKQRSALHERLHLQDLKVSKKLLRQEKQHREWEVAKNTSGVTLPFHCQRCFKCNVSL